MQRLASPRVAFCEEIEQSAGFQKETTKNWYYYTGPPKDPEVLKRVRIFAGPLAKDLTEDITQLLQLSTGRLYLSKFADGETSVQIVENIRGKDVYLVATTLTNDSWMELLLMVAAAKRSSAKRIVAVIPFFGYSRMDQRVMREPIAAADMCRMLEEMGVDHVVSVDLHSEQLVGFFHPNIPADNIQPWGVVAHYLCEQFQALKESGKRFDKIVVVASQENNMKRASLLRDLIEQHLDESDSSKVASTKGPISMGTPAAGQNNVQLAAVSKFRTRDVQNTRDERRSQPITRQLIGNVEGALCLVVDDLVDTGTTLTETAMLLKQNGAETVWAYATHGRFSAGGEKRVAECAALDRLLVTDTIPFHRFVAPDMLKNGKIRQLSIAPIVAETIHRMHDKRNFEELLYPK